VYIFISFNTMKTISYFV